MYGRHKVLFDVFVDFLEQVDKDTQLAKKVSEEKKEPIVMPVQELSYIISSFYQAAEAIRKLAETESKRYLVVDLKQTEDES